MLGNIIPFVFQGERFFREAWPQISQSVESGTDAASDVQWIAAALVAPRPPSGRRRPEVVRK
jgi:hypothetical protein